MQKVVASSLAALLVAGTMPNPGFAQGSGETATPIKHLVVIFNENISFDHYFATYPNAANTGSGPVFFPLPGTPNVNGLNGPLLTHNPNLLNTKNGTGATNPFRLDYSQAYTADQDHDYGPEQQAFYHGLMDQFPYSVGTAGPPPSGTPIAATTGLTMGYYDGNTVTGMWNLAQQFVVNDNSYGTTFGPSTVGAINLISGQTNGIAADRNPSGALITDENGGWTDIGDADPMGDVCSTTTGEVFRKTGQNIGDLLNAAGITWGFFEGGFNLSLTNSNGTTGCKRSTTSAITGVTKADYIQHHEPFQYYLSTANLTHARPTSVATIGYTDPANHQYDVNDFYAALQAGNLPSVSFLKAPGFQDAHAGYSDPIDEQNFTLNVIALLEESPEWSSTAVVIAYDDSDGWYDHQMGPIVNQSNTTSDGLSGSQACGDGLANALPGVDSSTLHAQGRCGYGPRLPMIIVSPWAKSNFVDHTLTDQSSIIHFVEDNWLGGERIGQGSFDAISGVINNAFDFSGATLPSVRYAVDATTGKITDKAISR
jgi:phospholipase C